MIQLEHKCFHGNANSINTRMHIYRPASTTWHIMAEKDLREEVLLSTNRLQQQLLEAVDKLQRPVSAVSNINLRYRSTNSTEWNDLHK